MAEKNICASYFYLKNWRIIMIGWVRGAGVECGRGAALLGEYGLKVNTPSK